MEAALRGSVHIDVTCKETIRHRLSASKRHWVREMQPRGGGTAQASGVFLETDIDASPATACIRSKMGREYVVFYL